jgi:hypothetical protein
MVFDAFMLEVNVFLIGMLSRVFEVLRIRREMLLESYQWMSPYNNTISAAGEEALSLASSTLSTSMTGFFTVL